MCPDAVISGQGATKEEVEEEVWHALQRSGMSAELDPWRLLLDGQSTDTSPFSCTNQKRAPKDASRSCDGVGLIYTLSLAPGR